MMERSTEDIVRGSAGDMQVAAAVTVMIIEGIRLHVSCTCHLGILGDDQGVGKECIWLAS